MQQLMFQIKNPRRHNIILPKHYSLKTFTSKDGFKWAHVLKDCSLVRNIKQGIKLFNKSYFIFQGSYFLMYKRKIVATCSLVISPINGKLLPYPHMLAVTQKHRGQRLGKLLLQAVINYCAENKLKPIYSETDDYRLGSLKECLELGFKPIIIVHEENHVQRWKIVYQSLNLIWDQNVKR